MTTREERSQQKQRVVDAVRRMRRKKTVPTVRAIGDDVEIKSTATVHCLIRDLLLESRLVYDADGRLSAAPPARKATECPICKLNLTQTEMD